MTTRQPLPDEKELLLSAKEGSLEAFTMLYEIYFPMVFRRVRYLVPQQDVEDVTQEIFIATMRSLKGFRGESKFSTWLRTLTNRQVAEYYRKKKQPEVDMDEKVEAPRILATSDEAILLRQELLKLPKKYQEVLMLRVVEEMPFAEIALHLGCSQEAGKSLFRRAISALQKRAAFDD